MAERKFGAMKDENRHIRSSRRFSKLTAMALVVVGIAFATYTHARGQRETGVRDSATELALKIKAPFTFAGVGDIIAPQPFGNLADPGYQSLIKVIHDADVGFANMEMTLVDWTHFPGPWMGTMGPMEVGPDIKAMGITIMTHANNHAFDGTLLGMQSTDKALDNLGIVHAGTGNNLNEARAARFLATPKGRVGLVGMVSMDTDLLGQDGSTFMYMSATYRSGDLGGRPGVDALRLTTYHVVTPEQLQSLRVLRDAVDPPGSSNTANTAGSFATPEQNRLASVATDRLRLFDSYFKAGTKPGTLSYEMNADDERDILGSIRNGKMQSDFMIATIHAHQGVQNINGVRTVTDWLVDLAHECIDNGADVFVVHGPHVLEGVEIYKGKPIFFGVSNFIIQSDIQISGTDKGVLAAPPEPPSYSLGGGNGPAEAGQEGLLVTAHYEGGRLVEVRLYPAYLGGKQRPISSRGLPTTPSPEIAQRILRELQTLSKPFGTTIAVEGNVGVIHVAPAQVGKDSK